MANYRGGRINEEVKREISTIIRNEIKDPRVNEESPSHSIIFSFILKVSHS